jgi:hypothetical protein
MAHVLEFLFLPPADSSPLPATGERVVVEDASEVVCEVVMPDVDDSVARVSDGSAALSSPSLGSELSLSLGASCAVVISANPGQLYV